MERQAIDAADLDAILRRAVEIQHGSALPSRDGTMDAQELVTAAEEAGISRDAVETALRERMEELANVSTPGGTVFAKSGDGYFYAARVLETDSMSARVKFLSGGEATVPFRDLRAFRAVPGEKVIVNLPTWGGWYTASVTAYLPEAMSMTVNCWGSTETVPLTSIRLARENSPGPSLLPTSLMYLTVGLTSGLIGGAIGAVVTWLVMR